MLNNSPRTERLLKAKLKSLDRTIRLRGVDCTVVRNTNVKYRKVHGVNSVDLRGDNSLDNKSFSIRLVLNLNNLEREGNKGNSVSQNVMTTDGSLLEGDIITYTGRVYEYSFKVDKKSYYGEENQLFEYELVNLKTITLTK